MSQVYKMSQFQRESRQRARMHRGIAHEEYYSSENIR